MAETEGFTGSIEHLSMPPHIEPFSPGVVEGLRSDWIEPAYKLDIIGGQEDVVFLIGLNGRVDGSYLDIGVERVEVVAHTNVFAVLVNRGHLNTNQSVVSGGGQVERTGGGITWMHHGDFTTVFDFKIVLSVVDAVGDGDVFDRHVAKILKG